MSITIIGGGIAGITAETDPTALKLTGGTLSGKLTCTTSASLSGINVGTVGATPTTLTNGDIWIGDALNFRNSSGATRQVLVNNTANLVSASTTVSPVMTIQQNGSTSGVGALVVTNSSPANAVRITQTGNGNALLVEDSSNPDSSPFVVTANGQTVIGSLTPYSTASLTVTGGVSLESGSYFVRVDSQGPQLQGSLRLFNQSTQNNSGSQTNTDYPYEFVVEINNTACYIPYRY
jgi:hypothetical protein